MAAHDQGDLEILLQLADGGGQGGLRHVAGLGGPREMLFAGERDEVGQVTGEHARFPDASGRAVRRMAGRTPG